MRGPYHLQTYHHHGKESKCVPLAAHAPLSEYISKSGTSLVHFPKNANLFLLQSSPSYLTALSSLPRKKFSLIYTLCHRFRCPTCNPSSSWDKCPFMESLQEWLIVHHRPPQKPFTIHPTHGPTPPGQLATPAHDFDPGTCDAANKDNQTIRG